MDEREQLRIIHELHFAGEFVNDWPADILEHICICHKIVTES